MLALSTKHRIDAATAMLPRRVRYKIGPSNKFAPSLFTKRFAWHRRLVGSTDETKWHRQ
jgi:hypothetical protein